MPTTEFNAGRDETMRGLVERDQDYLSRAFRAQLGALTSTGKKLVKEYQHEAALALFSAGLVLIPSDELHDNQFIISRGVYDAATRIANGISG